MWLTDALSDALGSVNAAQVKRELTTLVPPDALKILAAAGIRDEHVFPTPTVIASKPTLVGYYRLLLGVPQKTFYGSGSGMGQFKSMEAASTITAKQKAALPDFCSAMCQALAELVRQISPRVTKRDVHELPLLALGQMFQGANNNRIGQQAMREVFLTVAETMKNYTISRTSSQLVVKHASGRRVLLSQASDPDIRV
jgi:hypothetical protein